jgi:MFS family permease
MSMGIFGSIIAGIFIDRIGLETSTALTLVLGQLQMLVLIFFGTNQLAMSVSFWIYTVFRAFLYPVFISSLTIRLGFKYFGMLLGIGFALGGMTQLLMPSLSGLVGGSCHRAEHQPLEANASCDHGSWMPLHIFQFFILAILLLVPYYDRLDVIAQERQIYELLHSSGQSYGAIEEEEDE